MEQWFIDAPHELRTIAQTWFQKMRRCASDVVELMHDGCPVACIDDAPFAYVNSFRSHVNVGFFHGAPLADPAGLLQGGGIRMRHVKLSPGLQMNDAALSDLITAAYLDVCLRLGGERTSPNE